MELRSDGTGLREILSFDVFRDGRIPDDPQWSPDGRTLAVTLYTDASIFGVDVGVFTVDVDGSGLRRLVPFTSFGADWSPDGERVAFTLVRGASSPDRVEIYTARPDGTGLRRLTRSGRGRSAAEPAWSPDGTSIAFVRRGRGEGGFSDLYVVRPDGAGLRRLSKTPFGESSPDWGPRP
jgi:TolB protein